MNNQSNIITWVFSGSCGLWQLFILSLKFLSIFFSWWRKIFLPYRGVRPLWSVSSRLFHIHLIIRRFSLDKHCTKTLGHFVLVLVNFRFVSKWNVIWRRLWIVLYIIVTFLLWNVLTRWFLIYFMPSSCQAYGMAAWSWLHIGTFYKKNLKYLNCMKVHFITNDTFINVLGKNCLKLFHYIRLLD